MKNQTTLYAKISPQFASFLFLLLICFTACSKKADTPTEIEQPKNNEPKAAAYYKPIDTSDNFTLGDANSF